jgi:agmatinase
MPDHPSDAHPRVFFDLPSELSDPRRAAAAILPVPYDLTSSWKKGAGRGPEAILEASNYVEVWDIETRSEPYRKGIATLPPLRWEGSPEELADRVSERVGEILDRGQLSIVLGGEHSVTIGAVRAAAERFADLSVLQIDAHTDTRDSYHGSTYNHACVMARVRDTVYVTIDLDAFDPSILPATGTPEPGGLDWYQVTGLLAEVARHRRVVAFDVVELAPMSGHHASAFTAAKLIYRFLAEIFAAQEI